MYKIHVGIYIFKQLHPLSPDPLVRNYRRNCDVHWYNALQASMLRSFVLVKPSTGNKRMSQSQSFSAPPQGVCYTVQTSCGSAENIVIYLIQTIGYTYIVQMEWTRIVPYEIMYLLYVCYNSENN